MPESIALRMSYLTTLALPAGQVVVDCAVGPRSQPLAMTVAQADEPVARTPGSAHQPGTGYDATMFHWQHGNWFSTLLRGLRASFPQIGVLSDGSKLVVGARTEIHRGRCVPNAFLFDAYGASICHFAVGDGVEGVMVAEADEIVVSYFDEGIFRDNPLGETGLSCFDRQGNPTWKLNRGNVADCYALTISESSIWVYCYPDFDVFRISKDRKVDQWPTAIEGAKALAAWRDLVVLFGNYDQAACESAIIFKRQGDKLLQRGQLLLELPDGSPVLDGEILTRDDGIYVVADGVWYRASLTEIRL